MFCQLLTVHDKTLHCVWRQCSLDKELHTCAYFVIGTRQVFHLTLWTITAKIWNATQNKVAQHKLWGCADENRGAPLTCWSSIFWRTRTKRWKQWFKHWFIPITFMSDLEVMWEKIELGWISWGPEILTNKLIVPFYFLSQHVTSRSVRSRADLRADLLTMNTGRAADI